MNGITPIYIAETEGRGIDAIRKRWNAAFPGISFSATKELTESEAAALSTGKKKEATMKRSQTPAASNEVPPGKKTVEGKRAAEPKRSWFVLWPSLAITGASILLTVTGLYVFAFWAGGFLGLMFSLFLFMAVMVARDRMKGATSEQALNTVLRLEIGAAGLHCFTFWRLLPAFPDGEWFFYSRVAACVILAGFAAYLSYSAVLTVRNYNAEV